MHPEVLVGLVVLVTAYVTAMRRHRQRLAGARGLVFAAAVAALLAALTGPIHALAETASFSAHMVQHLLLMLVVAPCLLAGTPPVVLDALLAAPLRARGLGWLLRTGVRPVPALLLFSAALVAWHLPGPFSRALEADVWHVAEHTSLLAGALLAWWPVVSPSHRLPAQPYGARILYLFVFGVPMTVVAAMLTGAEHVLYPFYAQAPAVAGLTALEDQRLGGLLMWVPAGLVPLVAFTAVFFRWVAAEADDAGEAAAAAGPE